MLRVPSLRAKRNRYRHPPLAHMLEDFCPIVGDEADDIRLLRRLLDTVEDPGHPDEDRTPRKVLRIDREIRGQSVAERAAALEDARVGKLLRFARSLERGDDDMGEHTRRVGRTSRKIASALDLDEATVEAIGMAARLHDVGKIGIPDEILGSADPLSTEQFEVMKTHCTLGYYLLAGTDVSLLEMAAEIALTHHERWDGNGYPIGLAGEDIPLAGRIVSVADTFDALTSVRTYKRAWSHEAARSEIEGSAGVRFDPKVVEAFLESLRPEVMVA